MEAARAQPIKITRKSGEAFVLMNAEEFESLQMELAGLRGVASGLSDLAQGRIRKAPPETTQSAIAKAKARVKGKRSKKAVG